MHSFSAEDILFRDDYDSAMAADGLDPCVTRHSLAMILIM